MSDNLNFITFGCKLNTFETQIMREKAKLHQLDNITFINSCAVTNAAVKQTRQAIRKEKKANPKNRIVVTGCASELHTEEFINMPEVDCIIGNNEKTKTTTYSNLSDINNKIIRNTPQIENTSLIEDFEGRTRAFVQIQNGCDHKCTFCIIPHARGNSRSIPEDLIITQIQTLIDKGFHEIVLTGVDITAYGKDINDKINLGRLLKNIIKKTKNLKRLRVSSIDSIEINNEFIEVFGSEEKIMPHLHLSLQSGNEIILKRMLRRHQPIDAIKFCQKIRNIRPETVFGADIIAGFPTEDDEMHNITKKHIEDCDITYLHIFPYSAKAGTPAFKMPQVNKNIIQRRAKELRSIGEYRLGQYLCKEVGKNKKILVEKQGFGRTEQYSRVLLPDEYRQGELISKKIIGITKDQLIAESKHN